MRAVSVSEYLVMFGALVAVIATAVISLGRLLVFQAGTAEERYAQSAADEIASMINEVAALPDGSYYGFEPTKSRYNITITTTKVLVEREGKQTYATHLARDIVPVLLDSREKMCVQKSLGKILIKNGDCLDCTPGDGFCDSGCDGAGRCDPDCIMLGKIDGYCSRSCTLLMDDICDPDCNGKADGIWDPDCGCSSIKPERPCVEDGICDLDSGIADFSWDPDCVKEYEEGICDPDYNLGCDPDCWRDELCRGTCGNYTGNYVCFPACNNTACERCGQSCIKGCSSQPPGWLRGSQCRLLVNTTESMGMSFMKVNLTQLGETCGQNEARDDSFHLYYSGREEPVGVIAGEETQLVWKSLNGTAEIYFDFEPDRSLLVTDAWAEENLTVNGEFKAWIEDGVVKKAYLFSDQINLAKVWGRYDGEAEVSGTDWSRAPNYAQIEEDYESGKKKQFTVFSNIPGIMITSDHISRISLSFPEGFTVKTGDWGEVEGQVDMIVYCGGYRLSSRERDELGCTSKEVWVIASRKNDWWKWWLENRFRQNYTIQGISNMVGYGPTCSH